MTAQHDQNAGPDPYTSPKTFYGSELRRVREEAGLSQTEVGERCFCSGTYIGQFEAAVRRPQPDISRMLDEAFGTGKHFRRLCELARRSKLPSYFEDAAELEKLAEAISTYESTFVPSLLQTESYARALINAAQRFAPSKVVDDLVRSRMERGSVVDEATGPLLWVIIHEAVLNVRVGGASVMAEQLSALAETMRMNRRVLVQVLPYAAGEQAFLNGTMVLMAFADSPPAVYTESAYTGQLIDEPSLVAQYQRAYDLVRAASLPSEASLALIESTAKEFAKQ
ncbi:helix-turn-helix transcriptional regulator [Streptomyces cremeus]|uniref:helix-turn-helix domain-containing protein n=1 Tax=Streptomyces cremeus TaxID=66881 RepID=UPI0031E936EA